MKQEDIEMKQEDIEKWNNENLPMTPLTSIISEGDIKLFHKALYGEKYIV